MPLHAGSRLESELLDRYQFPQAHGTILEDPLKQVKPSISTQCRLLAGRLR